MSDIPLTRKEREQRIRDVIESYRNVVTAGPWAKLRNGQGRDAFFAQLREARGREP